MMVNPILYVRAFVSSIRFRLTLWYVVVISLVLLVFSVLIVSAELRNRLNETDTILSRQAQLIGDAYSPATGRIDLDTPAHHELLARPDAQSPLRDVDLFALFDLKGAAIQHTSLLTDTDLGALGSLAINRIQMYETYQLQNDAITENKGYRVYAIAVLQDNKKVATLMVGRAQDSQQLLARFIAEFAILLPIIVALTALGAYWLASRTLEPVRLITRAARDIGETDLSRRLNLARHDEIGELADTFDQMLARLDAAFARQRQFTHDASHELRTPLTIVNLELHRVLGEARTSADYQNALAVIQFENQYMTRLVNDLLMLARADGGGITLRREPLDLSDLALEVAERLAGLARQRGIELRLGQLPETPLDGDRLYLTQMLTNIVENAIKYSAGVGHRVSITVDCRQLEGRLWTWVQVADDGIGIAPEHLPHLFDRFYRVDSARQNVPPRATEPVNIGGSGLGLSIVQWIVQIHGGRINVNSQAGMGTTFEVFLPWAIAS